MFRPAFRIALEGSQGRLLRLLALTLVAAAPACTKVVEQPPAPPAAIAPSLAETNPEVLYAEVARKKRLGRGAWSAVSKPAGSTERPEADKPKEAAQGTGPTSVPREKLQEILDGALPTLTSCWDSATALQTSIAFEVTGAGKAENVRMPGAPKDTERCVAGRVSALALPTYTGPALTIQIPVSVTPPSSGQKAAAGTPSPGGAAAAYGSAPSNAPATAPGTATAAAPSVFVNP
jgi:hypothetical protein